MATPQTHYHDSSNAWPQELGISDGYRSQVIKRIGNLGSIIREVWEQGRAMHGRGTVMLLDSIIMAPRPPTGKAIAAFVPVENLTDNAEVWSQVSRWNMDGTVHVTYVFDGAQWVLDKDGDEYVVTMAIDAPRQRHAA